MAKVLYTGFEGPWSLRQTTTKFPLSSQFAPPNQYYSKIPGFKYISAMYNSTDTKSFAQFVELNYASDARSVNEYNLGSYIQGYFTAVGLQLPALTFDGPTLNKGFYYKLFQKCSSNTQHNIAASQKLPMLEFTHYNDVYNVSLRGNNTSDNIRRLEVLQNGVQVASSVVASIPGDITQWHPLSGYVIDNGSGYAELHVSWNYGARSITHTLSGNQSTNITDNIYIGGIPGWNQYAYNIKIDDFALNSFKQTDEDVFIGEPPTINGYGLSKGVGLSNANQWRSSNGTPMLTAIKNFQDDERILGTLNQTTGYRFSYTSNPILSSQSVSGNTVHGINVYMNKNKSSQQHLGLTTTFAGQITNTDRYHNKSSLSEDNTVIQYQGTDNSTIPVSGLTNFRIDTKVTRPTIEQLEQQVLDINPLRWFNTSHGVLEASSPDDKAENGDLVVRWNDFTGASYVSNSNISSQPQYSSNGINNQPCLYIASTDGLGSNSDHFVHNLSASTHFYVIKPDSVPPTADWRMIGGRSYGPLELFYSYFNTTQHGGYYTTDGATIYGTLYDTIPLRPNETYIVTARIQSGDSRIYNNGHLVQRSTTTFNNIIFDNPVGIGTAWEGGPSYSNFVGYIGDYIFFNRVLRQQEIDLVHNYLTTKFGGYIHG